MDSMEIDDLVTEIFQLPTTLATLEELKQQAKAAYFGYCYSDIDQNGVLTVDEITTLCEKMGLQVDHQEEEMLAKMDADGSNTVEQKEFLGWWLKRISKLPNPIKQQEIIARNTFHRFDTDGSNTMDAAEFKDLTDSLGADFTDDEVTEVIHMLDTDQSGTIDGDEFLQWWLQRSSDLRYANSSIAIKLRKLASRASQRFSTDIFTAAWHGDEELVKAFLGGDTRIAASTDPDNDDWNAIHYAAYKGHESIVQLLIAAGVNANVATARGFTPLFYAAQNGRADVCSILMEAGGDPTLWAEEGDVWMCALEHCIDSPALRDILAVHSKCVIPNLSETQNISASISTSGTISLTLPSSKSISTMPIRSWDVNVCYVEGNTDRIETFNLRAGRPSDKQSLQLQPGKKYTEAFFKCGKEKSLKLSVVAVDPLGRKGVASPLTLVASFD